jgi:hypothetical protein
VYPDVPDEAWVDIDDIAVLGTPDMLRRRTTLHFPDFNDKKFKAEN